MIDWDSADEAGTKTQENGKKMAERKYKVEIEVSGIGRKEYQSVRINFREKKDWKNFKDLETATIVEGKDFVAKLNDFIFAELVNLEKKTDELMMSREILDSQGFMQKVFAETNRRLTRSDMQRFRLLLFEEGKDYYSAPNGDKKAYRYDYENCLAKIIKDNMGMGNAAKVLLKNLGEK